MGQDVEALTANGIPVESWQEAEAPARRRRWYDSGRGTLAVLLASASDVDDLVPTLVAFQIEWNKIRVRMRGVGLARSTAVPRRSARGVRPRARRQRRRLGAPARRLGRGVRRADAADRPEATVAADPDAWRHAHRLRPTHPALVGSGQRRARRRRADRASSVFRQLELPQPCEHRHRHRPRPRARAGRVRRAAGRRRHPAPGADRLPRGPQRGLVGELPVLRRAAVLRRTRARGRGCAPGR